MKIIDVRDEKTTAMLAALARHYFLEKVVT